MTVGVDSGCRRPVVVGLPAGPARRARRADAQALAATRTWSPTRTAGPGSVTVTVGQQRSLRAGSESQQAGRRIRVAGLRRRRAAGPPAGRRARAATVQRFGTVARLSDSESAAARTDSESERNLELEPG